MPNRRINTAQLATKQPDPFGLVTTRNFDQGSYASFATVSPDVYRITPYNHLQGTTWAWWALRSGQFAGKTPHFLIAKAGHFNLMSGEWLACWATAADTDTWYQFDNVSIGASDIEFWHNTAFPAGTIYISALPMYPFSRVTRRVGVLASSVLVGETISSTNKIVATMTARDANDGTGRTSPALPLYGFKVANQTANTKNKIVLSSLQHPSETPGAYALEGALDWLIAAGASQKFLLDWFNFYVYPCRNVQGVYSGYFRVQPQNKVAGADFTTSGQWEEVDLLKPAIIADIGSSANVMLDYHSYMGNFGTTSYVVNGDTTGLYPIYAAALTALDASFTQQQAAVGGEDGTLGKLLRDTYGVTLYATLEQGGVTTRGIADWKAFGANSLKALTTLLAQGNFAQGPGVGARSFNGTTDRLDRANAANLKDHALTISLWVYIDAMPANGYLFCIHQSGDAAVSMYLNLSVTSTLNYIGFGVLGTSNLQRASDAGNPTTGSWIHYIVTWDGVITDATGVHIYKNNVEVASYSVTTAGSASVTATGKWSMGGRYYDDARNVDAKIAQLRVFDRVITAGERALEAADDTTTISGLVSWLKGNTSSLTDAADAATWTADGTTQLTGAGNGPAIIYP